MTQVLIDQRTATASGAHVPTRSLVAFAPSRRVGVDSYILLPEPFEVDIQSARVIELMPSGVEWCWVAKEVFTGHTRYLMVPDSEDVIPYGNLVDVDPASFDPMAEPEAAWWAALEDYSDVTTAARDDAVAAAGEAGLSAAAAGLSAASAAVSEGLAEGHASDASGSAGSAASSASAASSSAVAAAGSEGAAAGHATDAQSALDLTVTARDLTLGYRDTAAGHATTATTQAGLAATARTGAEDARDDAAAYAAGVNVQVGGRNFIPDSVAPDTTHQGGTYELVEGVVTPYGTHSVNKYTWTGGMASLLRRPNVVQPGVEYTFSVWGRTVNEGETAAVEIDIADTTISRATMTNEWSRIEVTDTYTGTSPATFNFVDTGIRTLNVPVYLAFWKLEKGNRATDWTPAPEDIGVNPDTAQWAAPHSLALELAASTIVGVGRPDIPATLTTGVASRLAAATSGTVFRSTTGPQGAWEWRKKGATWVCIEGDTGWVYATRWDTEGVVTVGTLPPGIEPAEGRGGGVMWRRLGPLSQVTILGGTTSHTTPTVPIPLGFRPEPSSPYPRKALQLGEYETTFVGVSVGASQMFISSPPLGQDLGSATYAPIINFTANQSRWPTSLTL